MCIGDTTQASTFAVAVWWNVVYLPQQPGYTGPRLWSPGGPPQGHHPDGDGDGDGDAGYLQSLTVCLVAIPILTALARIHYGRHHLGDTMAGGAVGVFASTCTMHALAGV